MTTTLEVFAGRRARNYETLPTLNVEILPDTHRCATCSADLAYVPHPKGPGYGCGTWIHTDPATPNHGYIAPALRCHYCHTHEGVEFKQHAWFDATKCKRCGGVNGHAIGD